jgi:ribosome maturation factor RimP
MLSERAMQARDVQDKITPVIADMGFEVVGVETSGQGRHAVLRLFVDKVGGINIDELTQVSRQVRDTLQVAGFDVDGTSFEVSSPGINRPLYTLKHFEQFKGSRVKVQMHIPVNGRKSFTGTLTEVSGDTITVDVDGQSVVLPFGDIAKAKLSPERS